MAESDDRKAAVIMENLRYCVRDTDIAKTAAMNILLNICVPRATDCYDTVRVLTPSDPVRTVLLKWGLEVVDDGDVEFTTILYLVELNV